MRSAFPIFVARRLVLALTALVGLSCSGGVPGPEDGMPQGELRVAAASDLQTALPQILEAYHAATKMRVKVTVTYGSSGQLARQIKAGAPFDVFLAANETYINDLVQSGDVLTDSNRRYAIGSLGLAVIPALAGVVKSLNDLTRPEVKKVAIADPEVAPYGFAARTALERSGLWDQLSDKIVLAGSVRQAFQFVATGNAEAGLISRATVAGSGADLVVIPIPSSLHDPIIQAAGVVRITTEPELARGFLEFLGRPAAQKVLTDHGFALP